MFLGMAFPCTNKLLCAFLTYQQIRQQSKVSRSVFLEILSLFKNFHIHFIPIHWGITKFI